MPRNKHVEALPVDLAGPGATGPETTPEGEARVDPGMWIANVRSRADKVTEQRRSDLNQLKMR